MALEDQIKKRSFTIKNNWSFRSKKYNKRDEVPTRQEIEDWLRSFKEFRCAWTGELIENLEFQVDHNIPISRDGTFRLDNCLIMTKKSNMIKGSLTLEELNMLKESLKDWPDKGEAVFQRLYQSSSAYKNGRK